MSKPSVAGQIIIQHIRCASRARQTASFVRPSANTARVHPELTEDEAHKKRLVMNLRLASLRDRGICRSRRIVELNPSTSTPPAASAAAEAALSSATVAK